MTKLSVFLLGSFEVRLGAAPVTPFAYAKVQALLAYLVAEADHPHSREMLAEMLWPALPDRVARNNLRQTISRLRKSIADDSVKPPYLISAREAVQFNQASDYGLDLDTFLSLTLACERHDHQQLSACDACIQRLEQAVALYRGNFLDNFVVAESTGFEEWANLKREWLQAKALSALFQLADHYLMQRTYDRARAYAWRQIELEPWREEAHRQLMSILALSGERSAALAQYTQCRRILAEELGVEPGVETTRLYQKIRSGQYARPPKALAVPYQLPIQPTPFVGRVSELAQMAEILGDPDCRLLTLVGFGGTGKTRLAVQIASDQLQNFENGVYFVPLLSIESSDFLTYAIASAIDLSVSGVVNPKVQLLNYLRNKTMLLILDNFEHLLDSADVIAEILGTTFNVKILVTSRERLNLQGEWIIEVHGMPVPAENSSEDFESYSSVQLFALSARRVRPNFSLDDDLDSVIRICQLVKGMPLGIELAAAWLRLIPCRQIAEQISRDLDFLTTETRNIPERHRSLRALFEHSWELLSLAERRVFMKLSVFRGGFDMDAAKSVADATIPTLGSLVDKSLVREIATGRYDMYELLHQFVHKKLLDSGEWQITMQAHLECFLKLAEDAEPHLRSSDQLAWLARLEVEHNNLRAALEYCQQSGQQSSEPHDGQRQINLLYLRLVGALAWFWQIRYVAEGRLWLERALALAPEPTVARAKALYGASSVLFWQSDVPGAGAYIDECLTLCQTLDIQDYPYPLYAIGLLRLYEGDAEQAQTIFEACLRDTRIIANKWCLAGVLLGVAKAATTLGDGRKAVRFYEESLNVATQLGDRWTISTALGESGNVLLQQGDFKTARARLEEALKLQVQLGHRWPAALTHFGLGQVFLHECQYEMANTHYCDSLTIFAELASKQGIATCLAAFAELAYVQQQTSRAVRLYAAADALRVVVGVFLQDAHFIGYDKKIDALRSHLDPDLEMDWMQGHAMPIEQAVSDALQTGL